MARLEYLTVLSALEKMLLKGDYGMALEVVQEVLEASQFRSKMPAKTSPSKKQTIPKSKQ